MFGRPPRHAAARIAVAACALTLLFALSARADWPQYHANPARTGVATSPALSADRLDRLEIKWSRATRPSEEGVNWERACTAEPLESQFWLLRRAPWVR